MGGARASVLVVVGPGDRREAWEEHTRRHAGRLGLRLTWREADDAAGLCSLLRTAPDHDAVVLASGPLAASVPVAEAVRGLGRPVVHVDAHAITGREVVHLACDRVVHGRGRRSFTGALDHLHARRARPPTTIAYDQHPAQVGDLRLPEAADGNAGPAPVVVLLHGGFWLDPYERDLMDRLAVALTDAGWATWNVEYRRRGASGGGWPATLEDACAAVDAVVDLDSTRSLDAGRVVLVGHSAGAQLALYAATRADAPADAPGRTPRTTPIGVASLAGVLDLEAAAAADLADGAVESFLGPRLEHPDRYRLASPTHRVPVGLPLLAVHGPEDRMVPVDQTTTFAEVARDAGDDVEVALVDTTHLDVVDPDGPAAAVVSTWLDRLAPR